MTGGSNPRDIARADPIVADEQTDQITLVLADDHQVVRGGLKVLLEAEPDMAVVAEAGDADTARRRVIAYRPRVLVLDLNMPGEPSLEAIPRIRADAPETAIVVLTMQNAPGFAREALRAGAAGFLVKDAAGEELVEAIRAVARGETYINPQLGARVAAEPQEPEGAPGGLSTREAEVLGLVALGHTNPEIAERLVLSVRTVETHRANIQRKLHLNNRAELVRYALDNDLIESQNPRS